MTKGDRSPVKKEDEDCHDQPNSLSVIGFGPEVENQRFAKNSSCDVGDSHVFDKMPCDGETEHRMPDSQADCQCRTVQSGYVISVIKKFDIFQYRLFLFLVRTQHV